MSAHGEAFWAALDELLARCELVIDRPQGSGHSRYPERIYPLDYGYLAGTTAADGDGLDVWRGSLPARGLVGALCTVDLFKRDVELKLLLGCTPDEIERVAAWQSGGLMQALVVMRTGGAGKVG